MLLIVMNGIMFHSCFFISAKRFARVGIRIKSLIG
jgi:hypothetical protein